MCQTYRILDTVIHDLSESYITKPILSTRIIKVIYPDGTKKEINEAEPAEIEEFKVKIKNYVKDERELRSTIRSLFNVVWGQCLKMIKTKIKVNINAV